MEQLQIKNKYDRILALLKTKNEQSYFRLLTEISALVNQHSTIILSYLNDYLETILQLYLSERLELFYYPLLKCTFLTHDLSTLFCEYNIRFLVEHIETNTSSRLETIGYILTDVIDQEISSFVKKESAKLLLYSIYDLNKEIALTALRSCSTVKFLTFSDGEIFYLLLETLYLVSCSHWCIEVRLLCLELLRKASIVCSSFFPMFDKALQKNNPQYLKER